MDGKVALVTGSTRGIGKAIAVAFAAEGAKVVVTGRSEDAGESVADSILAAGGEAIFVRTDVGVEEDVRRAVDAAVRTFGRLTTLVNNAAPTDLFATTDGGVVDLTTDTWETIVRLTITSVFWASKYSIPRMMEAGGGSIVNISSDSSLLGMSGVDSYTASKGAMNSLTRSMAVEYAGGNIRCNCLAVGFVPGDSPVARAVAEDEVLGAQFRAVHLTRLGRPSDVAYAALWLASDEAEFVTGTVIPIDGGMTIKSHIPDMRSEETRELLIDALRRAHVLA